MELKDVLPLDVKVFAHKVVFTINTTLYPFLLDDAVVQAGMAEYMFKHTGIDHYNAYYLDDSLVLEVFGDVQRN